MHLFFKFLWNIVTLPCYVSFCGTESELSIHVHISPLFFRFPFQSGHHRAMSRVPCASMFSSVTYFIHSSVYNVTPSPNPSHPHPTFVLNVCVSISALQIGSSITFFYFPHICLDIWCLFFTMRVFVWLARNSGKSEPELLPLKVKWSD